MPRASTQPLKIPASAARRLLLQRQGLSVDPDRRATTTGLQKLIEQMGFVQIDTINVIERAHHLTLFSRLHNYQPRMLAELLEKRRSLWEHWTHDASAIPTQWFAHWNHRFERYRTRIRRHAWWKARLGENPDKTIATVRERIAKDGPLLSRDFEHDHANHPLPEEGWWGWKPAKAALEHLWRSGELAVVRRVNFQKVYDLTARVLPDLHTQPAPEKAEHVEWSCTSALERLGMATPAEIAAFWNAIDLADARAWCAQALREGRLIALHVEDDTTAASSKARIACALVEDERHLRRLTRAAAKDGAPPADDTPLRLLSPFDPVVRDRKRAQRLFNFDYRFEAFTPAPQRKFGYYVMPLLQGDRLVGRVDPKFHRERGELVINGLWWEKGIEPTRARKAALNAAMERLAKFIGAERVVISR